MNNEGSLGISEGRKHVILSGSETWTLKEQGKSRITTAEMKFVRKTAKYILFDHKRNGDIRKELKTRPVLKKSQQLQIQMYKTRSRNTQISTYARWYGIVTSRKEEPRPTARPLLGLLDCYTETGTGHGAVVPQSMMTTAMAFTDQNCIYEKLKEQTKFREYLLPRSSESFCFPSNV
jgi:hypothetical protein